MKPTRDFQSLNDYLRKVNDIHNQERKGLLCEKSKKRLMDDAALRVYGHESFMKDKISLATNYN